MGNSPSTINDNQVLLFSGNYVQPSGRFSLPNFVVNSASYIGHGRTVFFNNAGSVLYVLMQADSAAGLTNDYALYTIPIGDPASCTASLSASNVTIGLGGGIYTVGVVADPSCLYQATVSADWIQLSSNYYGSGSNTLTYQVRPNLTGAQRNGTISLGGATLGITETTAGSAPQLNPLSIKVAGVDYSRAVDKIILVAGLSPTNCIYMMASRRVTRLYRWRLFLRPFPFHRTACTPRLDTADGFLMSTWRPPALRTS